MKELQLFKLITLKTYNLIFFLSIRIYNIIYMSLNTIQRYSHDIFKKPHKVFIEGHRGVNREFFENSIESFKQAIKYNLDSIELDIWLTKDKIPIVIHGGFRGCLY